AAANRRRTGRVARAAPRGGGPPGIGVCDSGCRRSPDAGHTRTRTEPLRTFPRCYAASPRMARIAAGGSPTTPRLRNPSMPERDLELYDRYFTVVPASTPELLDAAYVLRYQVYCNEHAFENPAEHPDGREVD